ncbi:MAG TPA: ribonuclease P protein component [Roseiarcus sp.]
MREPDALGHDARRAAGEALPPDVPFSWGRLRRRAEFQRVSRGRRTQAESFTLQANARADGDAAGPQPRVGFTVTKKVGGSVERNRIRRRLREALRLAVAIAPSPGHDYVLMARREALTRPFSALIADIERAFAQMSRPKPLRANGGRAPATDREQRS